VTYRTFHPKAEYTVFSSKHGTFSRDYNLGHKSSISNLRKGNHINYGEGDVKNTTTWRVNSMFLNDQWLTEEIKEEIKNTRDE